MRTIDFCVMMGLVAGSVLAGEARADLLVLQPVSRGMYYSGFPVSPWDPGESARMNPIAPGATIGIAMSVTPVSPLRGMYYGLALEYSLAALPENVVVTGATLTYTITYVQNGMVYVDGQYGFAPPHLVFSTFDGGDGEVMLADMLKPDITVGVDAAPVVGLATLTLGDMTSFNDRASDYVGLSVMEDLWIPQCGAGMSFAAEAVPTLTVEYVLPEPASAGVLGVVGVMLLRRRSRTRGAMGRR